MSDDTAAQSKTRFTMRGESMTRIEAFVAAAFAFAVTMLVISLDEMPANFDELVAATKQIPAFAASCASIIWIWYTHAKWSRRYGLEDGASIFLSGCLIFLVLIYIYPLRLMMQGLFFNLSNGYFPMEFTFASYWQLRFMFAFYALGLFLLSLNFVGLYYYAFKKRTHLNLRLHEVFDTKSEILMWSATGAVCLLSFILSLVLPSNLLPMAGFALFLLFPVLAGLGIYLGRKKDKQFEV